MILGIFLNSGILGSLGNLEVSRTWGLSRRRTGRIVFQESVSIRIVLS